MQGVKNRSHYLRSKSGEDPVLAVGGLCLPTGILD